MIGNLQQALLIGFAVDTNAYMHTYFSSIGLPLISNERKEEICLQHYPKFCNKNQGYNPTGLIAKLEIIHYMANYEILPSSKIEYAVYMIPLLITTQICHATNIISHSKDLGFNKKHSYLLLVYFYTSIPFLFSMFIELGGWKINGLEDTYKMFLLITGIWFQQFICYFLKMVSGSFNSRRSPFKIMMTGSFCFLYFGPLLLKYIKEDISLKHSYRKRELLTSSIQSCSVLKKTLSEGNELDVLQYYEINSPSEIFQYRSSAKKLLYETVILLCAGL